jgi:hypothetical protein
MLVNALQGPSRLGALRPSRGIFMEGRTDIEICECLHAFDDAQTFNVLLHTVGGVQR